MKIDNKTIMKNEKIDSKTIKNLCEKWHMTGCSLEIFSSKAICRGSQFRNSTNDMHLQGMASSVLQDNTILPWCTLGDGEGV